MAFEENEIKYATYIKEFKQELIIAGYSDKTLKMYLIYLPCLKYPLRHEYF